ncbi:hypothetical protein Tco_0018445 [Tanacetum coccineum]
MVATPKYATSTEQTISVTVNKGDDVGNHIEHKPCRKDKRCYLGVLLSEVTERFHACPDLWDPWILKETAKYVENQVQNMGAKNCERMTMQAASEATQCESKGEHDGKIFDMTVDTSLASPAAPNTIVSSKSIAKIGKSSSSRCTSANTCKKNGMVSQMILQAASHTLSMSMTSAPGLLYVD